MGKRDTTYLDQRRERSHLAERHLVLHRRCGSRTRCELGLKLDDLGVLASDLGVLGGGEAAEVGLGGAEEGVGRLELGFEVKDLVRLWSWKSQERVRWGGWCYVRREREEDETRRTG